MDTNYQRNIDDLERAVRVPLEQQIEGQDPEPPRDFVEPEEFDRLQLLSNPAGAGRLNPRRQV